MKNTMSRVLTVSVIAMMAVSVANAKMVSETMLGTAGHYGTGTGQVTVQSEIAAKANSADLATVATSGSYNDLTNKPTLGTAAAKNTTDTYSSSGTDPVTGKAVASAISGITTTANNAIQKTVAADKNGVMVRDSAGTYVKGTGTDVSVSDAGEITVNHAASADSADAVAWSNVSGKPTFATVATSGSYNDLSNKPTIGNATLTIQRNGVAVDTFTANATSNKTINITDSDTTYSALSGTELTGSGTTGRLITGAQYGAKQDVQIGATTDAGKAVVVDSNGKISMSSATLKTVATSGSYNDLSNKPTLGTAAAKNTTDTYSSSGTDPVTGKAVASAISGKQNNLGGSGNDGKVVVATSTAGTVNYRAIDTTSGGTADSTSLITSGAVNSGLSGKQTTANMEANTNSYTKTSTTKYPSMAVAQDMIEKQLDASLAAYVQDEISGQANTLMVRDDDGAATSGTGSDITVGGSDGTTVIVNHATSADTATKATQDASGNVITSTYATKTENSGKVSTAQGSGAANKAVITNSSGNITTGTISAGMIASDAVETAKIKNANVTAPKIADNVVKGSGIVTVTRDSNSNFVVSASHQDISGKVDVAQGSGAASKAVITDASGNVTTGTIATGMIADSAVTTAKIADSAVTTAKLGANSVTSAKIADGTIVNADINASAAIASSKIADLAKVTSATVGNKDGTYVLTAKVTDGTATYYWEDIGR